MYKQALDLLGAKNLLDMGLPGQAGYNGIFKPDSQILKTPTASALDAVAKSLEKRFKGDDIRIQRFNPSFFDKLRGIRGSFYTPEAKDIFGNIIKDEKGKPIPYVFLRQGQTHPGILAHQLGHADSKNLATKSRLWHNAGIPILTPLIAAILRGTRKDRAQDEYDKRDAITDAAIGAAGGIGQWKTGTNMIRSQLDASARALRNLKQVGDFSTRTINQSKDLLRRALKTYKRTRGINTAITAAAPMALNYLASLFAKRRKARQNNKVQ